MVGLLSVVYLCRPFYRTEMLIITAKNNSPWYHASFPDFKDKPYGPVLRKDLLHEVQIYELLSYCTTVRVFARILDTLPEAFREHKPPLRLNGTSLNKSY